MHRVVATFGNATPVEMTDFAFEVAVPKTLQLNLQRASATSLPSGSNNVTQVFELNNPQDKPIAIRTRIRFVYNGNPVQLQDQVNFPA